MKIKQNELNYHNNDPGAVKHGNFINYYSFNSVQSRLDHLDYRMFPMPEGDSIIVLDVGCNSGDLTSALHYYLQTRYEDCTVDILAIDIDPILIKRAHDGDKTNTCIEFTVGDIMDDDGKSVIQKYLEKHDRQCFDFTFCFSVTMWIHLNNGDDGLLDFLKYIQSISTSLIIEPQLWKCYKAAQKRLRKAGGSFENFESLQIRGKVDSVIENTILEGNFIKTFESTKTPWGRKVQCFRSKDDLLVHSYIASNAAFI